jgi:hypothetical protein
MRPGPNRSLTAAVICGLLLSATAVAQRGPILERPPDAPDLTARYIIYLHGRIVEDRGRRPTHETWRVYEYQQILENLAASGAVVISEQRPANTDPDMFAQHVADEVRRLLRAGVPREQISVIGFSKGGGIAMRASAILRDPRLRFVFLAACGDGDFSRSSLTVWGRILSVYEASDEVGQSCAQLFARSGPTGERSEIRIAIGGGHGAFFRPNREWLAPALHWVQHGRVVNP